MKEVWKDIVGYESRYQVSNFGRVKSVARIVNRPHGKRLVESKILSQQKNKFGYMSIILINKEHRQKTWFVHRLVAITFIPNPNNYPIVNHKDENKTNNNIDNLEWCDCKYNISYGTGPQRRAAKRKRQVEMIDKHSGKVIKTFPSVGDASKESGISRQLITDICMKRPRKYTAGGYIWRYADSNVREKRNVSDEIRMLNKYPEKRKVVMFDLKTGNIINTFNSVAEASKKTNLPYTTIYNVCCKRKYNHSCGGYGWRYADETN